MTKTIIWAVALVVSAIILANGGINAQREVVPIDEPDPPTAPTPVPDEADSVPVAITNFPTVDIRGFPHVVTVDGAVDVNNFPVTQNVAGTVNVGNLPLDEDGNLRVSFAAGRYIPIRASDFPLTIDSSGSYYLVEDVITTGDGITIEADHVTIDLMGFTIDSRGLFTIYSRSQNVTIMNGTLKSIGGDADDSTVILGAHSTVRNVTVEGGHSNGISVGPYSLVHGCHASCQGTSISTEEGSVVENTVTFRGGDESIGIIANGSIVRGCRVGGSVGVIASNGSIVSNNFIKGSAEGVFLSGSVLADSTVVGYYAGITVGSDSVVRGCRVEAGGGWGISVHGDGITVLGNKVSGSYGLDPDILVQGNRNRIEGNNLRGGRYSEEVSLMVDGIDNVIVKNTSSSQFDIAPGNIFGPIVNVAGGGDLADFTNSDHPLANFEY